MESMGCEEENGEGNEESRMECWEPFRTFGHGVRNEVGLFSVGIIYIPKGGCEL